MTTSKIRAGAHAQLRKEIIDQERWIDRCDSNTSSSYYGANGAAVRRADTEALTRLLARLYGRHRMLQGGAR